MVRLPALLVITTAITAAHAQSDGEDADHRTDRVQTEQLNRRALQASKPRISYREQDLRDYQSARARYERELAAWRQRAAACEAGDWSACR